MPSSVRKCSLEREPVVRGLYLAAAIIIFVMWVWSAETATTAINSDPRSKLSDLIYGTAHKPYVQRALVPLITRTIHGALPQEFFQGITESIRTLPKTQKEMLRLGWEEQFFAEYLIAFSIAFSLFLPLPFIARKLWVLAYPSDRLYTYLSGLAALLVLPPLFHTGPHYIYDLPALTFFTTALVLLLQRRWVLYYILFVVGCLNKETMVLTLWAYAALYGTRSREVNMFFHVAAHIVLFAAVKGFTIATFADNPGSDLEFHLYGNLHEILLGYTWSGLLIAGITVYLVAANFQSKPRILKVLTTLVIPFGGLILMFGVVYELRAAYEIFPILTFMMLSTIRHHLPEPTNGCYS